MIEIYHNARCSKSVCALDLLEQSGQDYKIRDYIKLGPDREELKRLLRVLQIPAIGLVRMSEPEWRRYAENQNLTEEQVIDAMVAHPILIERPIVIHNNMAVIGRPIERILSLL